MFRSQILLAFKVLFRRKFFAFVSLFGISLTLMVLVLVVGVLENIAFPKGPERYSERFLVAEDFLLAGPGHSMGGNLGYPFIENEVRAMQTPALVSAFWRDTSIVVGFRDDVKISSNLRRTDGNYWEILHFDFIEGRPYGSRESERGDYVAVISESTREQYFGGQQAEGKEIRFDGLSYEVVGVVRDVSWLEQNAYADIWVPILAAPSTQFRHEDTNGFDRRFAVLLLGETGADLPVMKAEYETLMRNYRHSDPVTWPEAYSYAETKFESTARNLMREGNLSLTDPESGADRLLALIALGMLLFMLLPAINLVNLNISRIMERSGEIGVRKSFGASSTMLVWQFVAENLVITALGGALGFVLALGAVELVALGGLLPEQGLVFSYRTYAAGLLLILLLGLLSGVYPAWRMARMDPVDSLKGVR